MLDPNKVASTSTDDFTSKMTYDHNHRLRTTTDADGYTSEVTYDRDGNVEREIDQLGNAKVYSYDDAGQVKTVTVPHAAGADRVTTYGYDKAGNRTTVTRPSGFVETTVYDQLNRPNELVGAK